MKKYLLRLVRAIANRGIPVSLDGKKGVLILEDDDGNDKIDRVKLVLKDSDAVPRG